MGFERAAAILLVGLVLASFLVIFLSLNSNFQPVYTQAYPREGVIQKIDFGLQSTPGFNISIPSGKYIREINMTLTNITAPNNIIRPEEDPNIGIRLPPPPPVGSKFLAMCFNLSNNAYLETNSAYLDNVSLYLQYVSGSQEINVTIRDADSLGYPSTYITSINYNISGTTGWVNIPMNHQFLDNASTVNGVFFVCVKDNTSISSDIIRWYADNDTPPDNDYGPEYIGDDGTWSPYTYINPENVSETVDFDLRVNISTDATLPYNISNPRNIGLRIDGNLPLLGYSDKGNGSYQLFNIVPQNGLAYFAVNSPLYNMSYADNPSITFHVDANYTLADISGISSLLPLALGLIGSSQGGGFLLFFGGGGLAVAAVGVVTVVAVTSTRRKNHLFNGLRKLSRFMALNASGINVFDFPLSEDESETDASLIAASVSAVGAIEAEADTRGSKVRVRREWFTTDKRVFFNLGFSLFIGDEAERSVFDGWWIGGVFDEPLIDEERNQIRKLFRALGDEAVRLARLDSNVYNSFEYWGGNVNVFREFFPEVLIGGLVAKGLSLDKVKELRLQGVQKSKMIFNLTEMGASILIQGMLASLKEVKSAVLCLNVNREMWVRDTKNLLNKKQINKLEKDARDKEALLYSTLQRENISRIQATSVYMMLLMKKLASRNVKLDVFIFGLPPEKVKKAGRAPPESAGESKIVLENFNPSDPEQWSLFTQKLFDIVSLREAQIEVKLEFKDIISDIDSWIKDHKGDEEVAKIIFTAGGLNTTEIIKLMKSQKLPHTYTLAIGAPLEEKIQTPAQFIPIPSISEGNIKPLKITSKKRKEN